MRNKNFGSANGKGYYIALILCAVAIGISGYMYYTSSKPKEPAQEQEVIAAATEPAEEQKDIQAVATQPQEEEPVISVQAISLICLEIRRRHIRKYLPPIVDVSAVLGVAISKILKCTRISITHLKSIIIDLPRSLLVFSEILCRCTDSRSKNQCKQCNGDLLHLDINY